MTEGPPLRGRNTALAAFMSRARAEGAMSATDDQTIGASVLAKEDPGHIHSIQKEVRTASFLSTLSSKIIAGTGSANPGFMHPLSPSEEGTDRRQQSSAAREQQADCSSQDAAMSPDNIAAAYRAIRDRNGGGYWGRRLSDGRQAPPSTHDPRRWGRTTSVADEEEMGDHAPPDSQPNRPHYLHPANHNQQQFGHYTADSIRGVSPIAPHSHRNSNRYIPSVEVSRPANFFPGGAPPSIVSEDTEMNFGTRTPSVDDRVGVSLQVARDASMAHRHVSEWYEHNSVGNAGLNSSTPLTRMGTYSRTASRDRRLRYASAKQKQSVYEQALREVTVRGGDTQQAYRRRASGQPIANSGPVAARVAQPSHNSRLVREVSNLPPGTLRTSSRRPVAAPLSSPIHLPTPTILSLIDASGQLRLNDYKTDPRTWQKIADELAATSDDSSNNRRRHHRESTEETVNTPVNKWKASLRTETAKEAQDGVWHVDRFQPSPRRSPGRQRLPLEERRRRLYMEDGTSSPSKHPFDPCACTKHSPRFASAGPSRTVLGVGEESRQLSPPRPEVVDEQWGPHGSYTVPFQSQLPPTVEEARDEAPAGQEPSRSHSALDHHAAHYHHEHCLHDIHVENRTQSDYGFEDETTMLRVELLTEREKAGRTALWAEFEERLFEFHLKASHLGSRANGTISPDAHIHMISAVSTLRRSGSPQDFLGSLNPIATEAIDTNSKALDVDSVPTALLMKSLDANNGGKRSSSPNIRRPEWRSPSPPDAHDGGSFPPLPPIQRGPPSQFTSLEQQVRAGLFRSNNALRSASADTAPPTSPPRRRGETIEPSTSADEDALQLKLLERERAFASEKQQWGEVYEEMKRALRSMAQQNTELAKRVSGSRASSSHATQIAESAIPVRSASPDGGPPFMGDTLRPQTRSAYYNEF